MCSTLLYKLCGIQKFQIRKMNNLYKQTLMNANGSENPKRKSFEEHSLLLLLICFDWFLIYTFGVKCSYRWRNAVAPSQNGYHRSNEVPLVVVVSPIQSSILTEYYIFYFYPSVTFWFNFWCLIYFDNLYICCWKSRWATSSKTIMKTETSQKKHVCSQQGGERWIYLQFDTWDMMSTPTAFWLPSRFVCVHVCSCLYMCVIRFPSCIQLSN